MLPPRLLSWQMNRCWSPFTKSLSTRICCQGNTFWMPARLRRRRSSAGKSVRGSRLLVPHKPITCGKRAIPQALIRVTLTSPGRPNTRPGRQGNSGNSWTPALDHKLNEVVKIKFSKRDCGRCPSKDGVRTPPHRAGPSPFALKRNIWRYSKRGNARGRPIALPSILYENGLKKRSCKEYGHLGCGVLAISACPNPSANGRHRCCHQWRTLYGMAQWRETRTDTRLSFCKLLLLGGSYEFMPKSSLTGAEKTFSALRSSMCE
jgi:hypothetical protein